MFIQDNWADWTERLKSIISSNIKKGVMVTHVFENIDWKNKSLNRIETHHMKSILIQKYDFTENLSNVSLNADYNFEWQNQWSSKASTPKLPNVYLKPGSDIHSCEE